MAKTKHSVIKMAKGEEAGNFRAVAVVTPKQVDAQLMALASALANAGHFVFVVDGRFGGRTLYGQKPVDGSNLGSVYLWAEA